MPKYDQFYHILAALRRTFSRSPLAAQARAKAKQIQPSFKKDGTQAKRPQVRYLCADCGNLFTYQQIQVDHIDPVVPPNMKSKDMSWDEIITRLFCSVGNLQVLCKTCHKKKSAKEREKRKRAS